MMAAAQTVVRHSVAMRSASRLMHSHSILSQQAESSSSSATPEPSRPRRSARTPQEDGRDVRRVDLVGPPDPVSNIRPMVYAPPDNSARRRQGPAATTSTPTRQAPSVHPYSAHEFHQTASGASAVSGLHRRRGGLAVFRRYRQYVDHVCDRVEEADMKLRLSKLTTDRTTQRFWRDNNTRFQRDLQLWQKQHEQQKQLESGAPVDSSSTLPAPSNTDTSTSLTLAQTAGLSSESDFYATWLRANAKRNKAYNVLVWRQAFDQVRLGARVTMWHAWLSLLRRLEGRQAKEGAR